MPSSADEFTATFAEVPIQLKHSNKLRFCKPHSHKQEGLHIEQNSNLISYNVRDYEKFGGGKMWPQALPPPNLGERLSEAKE